MKITEVKAIKLKCACEPISDALSTSFVRQALLIYIKTDSEFFGIGEAFSYGAPLEAMEFILNSQITPILIDQDPTQIEKLWQTMYWRTIANGRRSMTMGVISGVDIALWDLLGKMNHMPVAKLLGQYSDKVPSYASGGFYAENKGIKGLEEELEGYKRKGYKDMKIKIGRTLYGYNAPLQYMQNQENEVSFEEDCRRIGLAREIIGDGILIVDLNASWDAERLAEKAGMLSELGVQWIEEPIPFEDLYGYKRVRPYLRDMKLIGCETQQGSANFKNLLKYGEIDIIQPDVGWAGGISEVRKIGQIAKGMGKKISLHCFGSGVLFAASIHVAAAMENTERIESEENPNPLKTDIVRYRPEHDQKMNFIVPEKDGIGIELDWNVIEKYTV